MIAWIFLIALIVIYCITLPVLLTRANLTRTDKKLNVVLGYIPVVHFFPFLKLIKRPWWWFLLLLCPGVNLMMMVIMNVELGIAFNKRSTKEQWFFGALPWIAIPRLAFKEKNQVYVGPRDWTNKKKSSAREWGEAIVFAIVAASVIRTFFIEAFTIPTPSMEKSMLVGDYLFVSKISYGAKIPQTPVSVPFVHNALPGSMTNSYVDWFSLPYYRLPGLGSVERFDPVVFNFPNGDTIMVDPFYSGHDYYAYVNKEAIGLAGGYNKFILQKDKFQQKARENFAKGNCRICEQEMGIRIEGVKARPMDKKENYVKRCIGLPGENISINNAQVFINGQAIENPAGLMLSYDFVVANLKDLEYVWDHCKVNQDDRKVLVDVRGGQIFATEAERRKNKLNATQDASGFIHAISSFNQEDVNWLKSNNAVKSIDASIDSVAYAQNPLVMYPNSPMKPYSEWTADFYGPVHIPAQGETIELTPENIELYRRVIVNYEYNTLAQRDGQVIINGQPTTTYTFKQDYYWMMGDNRHNSADSRFWGFVPEDHIVGKPVFTWFSKEDTKYQPDGAIRWKRMFHLVK